MKWFTRVCAARREVHVWNEDLGVLTGERDKQDAKSKGNATHDVTQEAGVECGSYRSLVRRSTICPGGCIMGGGDDA